MKTSNLVLTGWIVVMLSGLRTTQSSIFEDHNGDYEQYVVALNEPASFDDSVQYLQICITAKEDTQVEIDLPATYLYRVARLTEKNDWSWNETILISSDLQESAYSKGFHIMADHPVNIVVIRNSTADFSLIPYLIFPLPKQNPIEYVISTYPDRSGQKTSSFLVATDEYRTAVDAFGPGSSDATLSRLSVDKYSIYEYSIFYPRDIIGFRLICSHPAAVYTKQQSTSEYPEYQLTSEENTVFFQVPPLARLGRRYVVGPPTTGTGELSYVSLVIVASRPNVSVAILVPSDGRRLEVDPSSPCQCQYDSTGRCQVNCTSYDGYETTEPFVEVRLLGWWPDVAIVVECDEACLLLMTTPSYGAYYSQTVPRSVLLVAPPRVMPGGVHFFVPPVSDGLHAQLMAVKIAVPTADIGGLLLDGLPIADLRPLLQYRTAAVSEWTVITVELAPGNHRVVHKADGRVPIAVHVCGSALDAGKLSTFGFPAAFPEPVEPSGDSVIYDRSKASTDKQPSQNTSNAANGNNALTVAVFIFLLAVCAAMVAIVIILVKNNTMLRALAPNPTVTENHIPAVPKDSEHDSFDLDRKIEIEEPEGKQGGANYLEPQPTPARYEPMRPTISETSFNETYDVIS